MRSLEMVAPGSGKWGEGDKMSHLWGALVAELKMSRAAKICSKSLNYIYIYF